MMAGEWSFALPDFAYKGMTDAQFAELLAVVGLANQFNRLAAGTRVEVDARYLD